MQKGLFGEESEQEKGKKEFKQLERNISTLLRSYQRKVYETLEQ